MYLMNGTEAVGCQVGREDSNVIWDFELFLNHPYAIRTFIVFFSLHEI